MMFIIINVIVFCFYVKKHMILQQFPCFFIARIALRGTKTPIFQNFPWAPVGLYPPSPLLGTPLLEPARGCAPDPCRSSLGSASATSLARRNSALEEVSKNSPLGLYYDFQK